MPYKFILSIIFLLSGELNYAQNNLPVITAASRVVTIRDGLHLMKGYWYIMPEKKPDYYYVEIPAKQHRVTFITDLDSISVDVEYGREYNFIVLLNNKDSCFTRIAARYKKNVAYKSSHPSVQIDTIPFTIGDNSKIYFKGRVNNSGPLDIQFDLGSGGSEIKKSSRNKVKMNFDSSVTLKNSDGTNVVPYSTINSLEIANLKWDTVAFAVASNMTSREDLIVGNSLFQNKVVEINYDKRIIIIHDTLQGHDDSYSRHDLILEGGVVPFINGSFTINSKKKIGWFMFDTGAYTTILQDNEVSAAHKFSLEAKKMVGISDKSLSPSLTIGNLSFSGFHYSVSKSGSDDQLIGLLGNDLLKRFNVILDNKNGCLYLRPNSLINEPYANPEYYAVLIITFVIFLIIASVGFIIYRKRKKKIN